MDNNFVNYNIDRLTNNREIINTVRRVERQINDKIREKQEVNNFVNQFYDSAIRNNDNELSIALVSHIDYSLQLSDEIFSLNEQITSIINNLPQQNGQGIRKKRKQTCNC